MAGAARMYRGADQLEPCFFTGGGYGNVYVLNPDQYTDDDYGQIFSYYVTCSLPTREQEQGLQLTAARKILAYLTGYISGLANVSIYLFPANLQNQWPLSITRTPGMTPNFDLECTGLNCEAYRMFFKIQPSPAAGQTDSYFNLQRFSPYFRVSRMKVRGAAQ